MIRAAALRDAPAIGALFFESMPSPWKQEDIEAALRLPTMTAWVWEEEGTLLGAILIQLCIDEAEILSIATAPNARRRGIGKGLLSYALKEAGRDVSVFLEVRAKNSGAIAFYQDFGFSVIGMRKNYYKNPADDALLMKFGKF